MKKPQPIIQVQNFKMHFGEKEVIKDLSFDIYKGEIFGLIGSNGSGKTTTIRALLGLYQPTGGKLLVDGQPFHPAREVKIGYLPEERGLYKKEKVGNILRYFANLKGINRPTAERWIVKFLKQVDLPDKINTRLDKLSNGQQQKIQLGVTIMGKPDILILDEPTKGFDPINRKLLLEIIEREHRRGATVLMITHYMEEAERLCDRILLLKDGLAKAYGRVEDIKDQAGGQRIKLTFNGKLPIKNTPFTVITKDKNYAELEPLKNPDEVLKYLVTQKVAVRQYSVERPSLDEIFVKIYGVNQEGASPHA